MEMLTYNTTTGWVLRTNHTLYDYVTAYIVIDIDARACLKHRYYNHRKKYVTLEDIKHMLKLSTPASMLC